MNFEQLATEQPILNKLKTNPIAYFCAEFALADELPIFSGGLGVLAGDVICEAGESNIPLVGVGLLYKEGYFKQVISNDHWQEELPERFEVSNNTISLITLEDGSPQRIKLPIADRIIYAQIWEYRTSGARLLLLDTDVPENSDSDRRLTVKLYPTDSQWRIQQEIILGIGGVRALHKLGIEPSVYHLNEGHSAFAIIEVAHQYIKQTQVSFEEALKYACSKIVFTNHTLIPSGNDVFNVTEVATLLNGLTKHMGLSPEQILDMGRVKEDPQSFSMTNLALSASSKISAVSRTHSEFAKHIWPDFSLLPITNGVNKSYWQNSAWHEITESLLNHQPIPDEEIWQTHAQLKHLLLDHIFKTTGKELNPKALLLTWSRRIAIYKQPELIFSDIERLTDIVQSPSQPVQILYSGKAHPNDLRGKAVINNILNIIKDRKLEEQIIFLPDYNLHLSHLLTAGSDGWLNTPIKGQEACGTSGMKAGLNGVLPVAISDGWTDEIDLTQFGFEISNENSSDDIYRVISEQVAPAYYTRNENNLPEIWIEKMKRLILTTSTNYTSERMLRQYLNELYLPIINKTN